MNYSYILKSSIPQIEKLLDFGFICDGDDVGKACIYGNTNKCAHSDSKEGNVCNTNKCAPVDSKENNVCNTDTDAPASGKAASDGNTSTVRQTFTLNHNLPNTDFYTRIKITPDEITATVFETDTNERYALFDVKNSRGAFVGELRQKVDDIINQIRNQCFVTTDLHEKFDSFVQNEFSCQPDFPWEDTPPTFVYRCANKKWFALMMNIPFKSLGLESEERVWVVNLKADEKDVGDLVDRKSIFPAYHMNKKYWITVLLSAVTDFEKLCRLTRQSYQLVSGKK